MATQYRGYKNIQINGDAEYVKQVTSCLDTIGAMHSGGAMFGAINAAAHTMTIGPRDDGFPSNYCDYGTGAGLTLLSQAIARSDMARIRESLAADLGTAARSGLTKQAVAGQLAGGLGAVTYDGAHNIGVPASNVSIPTSERGDGPAVMARVANATMQAQATLDEIVSGRRPTLPEGWAQDLQRILRHFLQPGRGTAVTIGFDPTQTYPCDADPARQNRPPLIGLAHEMVHGWRGITGRMLEIQNENFDIEEVITTGFPPYNSERFSENLFRSQYTGPMLVMRVTYSWLPSYGTDELQRSR